MVRLLRKSDEIKVVTEVLHLIGLEVEDKGVHRAVLIDNIRIGFSPQSCYTYLSPLHYTFDSKKFLFYDFHQVSENCKIKFLSHPLLC
jgi:hypothetical protein